MADFDQQSLYSEGASSIYDEERIKKLFQACDTNGDGYIDSEDLLTVCRELNLDYSLSELMHELGADETGRISYDEFLRRRLATKPEADAFKTSEPPQSTPEYLPTSSDNSLGEASGGKERWEFDSGARDLSPEPNTLQRLVEAAGGSITTRNAASLLQLANKLHLAALTSLRRDIGRLRSKLAAVTEERNTLLSKLHQSSEGPEADNLVDYYEERITELHSVIAELNRKLDWQGSHVIEEEAPSEAGNSVDMASQSEFEVPSASGVAEPTERSDDSTANASQLPVKALRRANCELQEKLIAKEDELFEMRTQLETLQLEVLELKQQMEKEAPGRDELSAAIEAEVEERFKIEVDLLNGKIARMKADRVVDRTIYTELKEHCAQISCLLMKYESNFLAVRLALVEAEKALETYVDLVNFLEALIPQSKLGNAKVSRLHETGRRYIAEKEKIMSTCLDLSCDQFTSYCPPDLQPNIYVHALEKAVVFQELMKERETKMDLRRRLFSAEKDRASLGKKLKESEGKYGELLSLIDKNLVLEGESSAGDGEFVSQLHSSLTKNLDAHSSLTVQLKEANLAIGHELEKTKRKYQLKVDLLESQIQNLLTSHRNQQLHMTTVIANLEAKLAASRNVESSATEPNRERKKE